MSRGGMLFGALIAGMLVVGVLVSYAVLNSPEPASDRDGDGHVDSEDAFPDDRAEWSDTDGDGIGDNADHSLLKDSDGDRYPDDEDAFPHDPTEWKDENGNGRGDNSEPSAIDSDEDGFADNVDLYPNEDKGIVFQATGIELADRVDLVSGFGEIYLVLRIDGIERTWMDDQGAPWSLRVGSSIAINESYRYNVDDNRRYTNIELTMVEDDIGSNDIVDIDGTSRTGRVLTITYDIVNGTWRGTTSDGRTEGSGDGTAGEDDDDGGVRFEVVTVTIDSSKSYQWTFDGAEYTLDTVVTPRAYNQYRESEVQRYYYYGFTDAEVQQFVTSDDPIVEDVAAKLQAIAEDEGFSELETINFALRFCQGMVYSYDNATTDGDEYWRFPVETLYDETGDCEDTSFLFASVAEAMGYDAAMFFLPGHAAVGIASDQATGTYIQDGDGTRYYYCETTGAGWELGDLPEGLEGSEVELVQVS